MMHPTADAATETSDHTEPTCVNTPDQDPAGGIKLSGRNRLCTRARALAGLVVTTGIIVVLSSSDTTSSVHSSFL